MNKVELLPIRGKRKKNDSTIKDMGKVFGGISFELGLMSIISLFISRASIMDGLTPFGIAFLVSYLGKYGHSIFIPLASSIGIMSIQGTGGYEYLTVIWFIYITHRIIIERLKESIIKLSIFSFVSLVVIRFLLLSFGEHFLYDNMMVLFEGVIVFSLTFIFNYSILLVQKNNRVFNNEEIICGVIMLSLAISGLGGLSIFGLSIQKVIGVFLVILFSYGKGPSMGTAVGVTMGVVSGMSTPNMPLIISIYGFSGLLSGLFRELGKVGSAIGFILGNGIITFYINGYMDTLITFKEVILGAIVFILLSKFTSYFDNKIAIGISKSTEFKDAYSDRLKDMTYNRLKEMSNVFEELATTFKRVSIKERIIEEKDISTFVDNVVEDVCKNCAMARFCWENEFYSTYQSMFEVMSKIESKGIIGENDLPDNLKKRCIKIGAIANKCNYLFDIYKLNHEWENKIVESRQLVSEQLDGLSKIIKDLASEIHSNVTFKEDVENAIYQTLVNNKIEVKDVIVTESESSNFEIILDIKEPFDEGLLSKKVIPAVSEVVGFDLVRDKFVSTNSLQGKRARFKLIRANRYGAITKVSKGEKSFNYVSGDSYTFGERTSNYFVALSDGMGVGQKANRESEITISLLEKFLEAGFDKELALKTINSILVLKSTEEIFATIDMSIIDLYMGKTQFIKIGSASTFIKKRNRVKIINSNSLPVGILKDVDLEIYEEELEDGDLIITMSDGVLDANSNCDDKEKWMKKIISEIDSVNPQRVADIIIEKANEVSSEGKKDDMTVLVTKIWNRRS